MIPWVREKFAERRAKWASSKRRNDPAETANGSDSIPGSRNNIKSNIESTSSLEANDRFCSTTTFPKSSSVDKSTVKDDHNARDKIKIRVISPNGRLLVITAEVNKRLIDVKNKALIEFSEDSESLPYFATDVKQLSHKYRLIRSDVAGTRLNDGLTLAQLGINENDTLVLAVKRTTINQLRNASQSRPPSADEIESATRHMPPGQSSNFVDMTEVMPESSYDVRRIFISLANTSAKIIGAGPYAQRLIYVLSQKIKNKKKHAKDTLESLVDIGFKEDLAEYALKIHNNIYAAALEWLLQHQNEAVPISNGGEVETLSPVGSASSSLSGNIIENTETLLKIVRIYSHRTIQPNPEAVQSLVDMGFEEQHAERALRMTHNDQSAACDYLCGTRGDSMFNVVDFFTNESPILHSIMELPHVQMSLGTPKMFLSLLAFLSSNIYRTGHSDSDTNLIITNIIHKYHEEKHVLGANQLHTTRL